MSLTDRHVWASLSGFNHSDHWHSYQISPIALDPKSSNLAPFVVSLLFYVYVFLVCESLRRWAARYWGYDNDVPYLVNEFAGCLQVSSMIYENRQIYAYYGLNAYSVSLALVIFLHCTTVRTAFVNPAPIYEMWKLWWISTSGFVAYLALQVSAGLMAYPVVKVFWLFKMRRDHAVHALAFECNSPLHVSENGVPPFLGLVLESGASCSLRIAILTLVHRFPKSYPVPVAIIWSALVRLGITKTGFYMNPILAISQTTGCRGLPFWEEVLVYVAGPFLGAVAAGRIYYAYIHGFQIPESMNLFKKRLNKTVKVDKMEDEPLMVGGVDYNIS